MRDANLRGTCLVGASLRGVDLRGADLMAAALEGAALHGSLFDAETRWPVDLDPLSRGALPRQPVVPGETDRSFSADEPGYQAPEPEGTVAALVPSGEVVLTRLYPTAPPLVLPISTLVRADLRGADFRRLDLTGLELRNACLDGAAITAATLADADVRGASFRGALLGSVSLLGTRLEGAALDGADVIGCDAVGTVFRHGSLRGARLDTSDLNGADLTGVDLSGAQAYAANLRGACLAGAKLAGVVYDQWTRWPDGFQPEACGAVVARRAPAPGPGYRPWWLRRYQQDTSSCFLNGAYVARAAPGGAHYGVDIDVGRAPCQPRRSRRCNSRSSWRWPGNAARLRVSPGSPRWSYSSRATKPGGAGVDHST